jgi:iron complex outermembrane receptor protein
MKTRLKRCSWFLANQFLSILLLTTTAVRAESTADTNSIQSLKRMSLDDLMNVEITSVSKKEEKLTDAPAAVYVLTQEDIHRSGATCIPEALRLVPGLDVARIDAHTWAISSRGFNGEFANKLLVLIDGRSVYTPLFSGVFWDVQDPMLEDVDRIEVIRGSGTTLWGANAVNGVINIITKSAKDTQGWLVSGGGGNLDRGFGEVRYGGSRGDDLFYRLYGNYFDDADSEMLGGGNGRDGWQQGRGGFRADWQPSRDNQLTVQGDAYDGNEGQVFSLPTVTPPYTQRLTRDTDISGGDVLGRWTHTLANGSEVKLQTYYDKTVRDTAIVGDNLDTFDVDLQYDRHIGSRQEMICGLGYRLEDEVIKNGPTIMLNPNHTDYQLFSGFVQDEVTLIPERLKLTLGTKLEHNDFTGFEVEPSGRISWMPTIHQTVWAAVSRAVRTPSEYERNARVELQTIPPGGLFPGSPPAVVTTEGDNAFDSENLIAYELGYRVRPCERVSLDFATFYNEYSRLGTITTGTPFAGTPPNFLVVPETFGNDSSAQTYGLEAAGNWQMLDWWRWQATYTYLHMEVHVDDRGTTSPEVESQPGGSPQQQFSVRSLMDLPHQVQFDATLRYVDSLNVPLVTSTTAQHVAQYLSLDLRLGWKPTKNVEFSIVGQDLLNGEHLEYAPTLQTQTTEVGRSIYGKVTLTF